MRSKHWRYLRYHDGSEELYDRRNDPDEYNNLAGRPGYAEIIKSHAAWLPRINREAVLLPTAEGTSLL